MDLESSCRELCGSLLSVRANERKKSAESLKDLLTRNALPAILSKNTLKKKGFSWNDLFFNINEYVLKETEKYESSKSFENVTGPLCSSLLHRCIAGANKGKAYLKCEKVLEACLFILNNNRLTKAIGDAYLNLLYKHVISCNYYLGFITPTNWEDLLNVCTSISLSTNTKLDHFTKLRLLSLVIKNGTRYCQIINPLRDTLLKFKKCFIQLQNNKKIQEVIIEIMIHLIETLSTECRLLMCDFTECVMPLILKYYDHCLEHKKKMMLFKVLELSVVLHHPGGKLRSEDGSLANNWETWERQLSNILEIITMEVTYLQKIRKQNDSLESYNPHFCSLAAAVYYQSFHSTADSNNDSLAGCSTKRQKVSLNKYRTFTDLIYQLQINHIPWLSIVRKYIKQYSTTISTIEYLSVMKILDILINGNSQNLDWEIFKDVSCLIIRHLTTAKTYKDDVDNAFLSLWNSCVRNSSATNASNNSLHVVMHALLKTNTLKYQHVRPLIKLYLEKSMPVNNSSVVTLNSILSHFCNKCNSLEQRTHFVNWLHEGVTLMNMETIKELLMRLIANENIRIDEIPKASANDSLFATLFNSIDSFILFSEFELEKPSMDILKEDVTEKPEINMDTNLLIQTSLENKCIYQTEMFKDKKIDLIHYLHSIKIILTYLDVVLKYQVHSNDEIKALNLYTTVESSLKLMFESLLATLKSNTAIPNKTELLLHVKDLMTYDYDLVLGTELRRSVPEDFFHYINNVLTTEKESDDVMEYEDDENEMNATSMKYNCVYTLAAYCRVRGNYREELLELILDPKLYEFSSIWDIKCAFQCIEILNQPGVEEPPLAPIFVFMQNLCKELFRVPDATFELLNILFKILDSLWTLDDEMKQNSYIMIRGYLDRCEKSYYPPKLAALIYKCASKVISLNNRDVDTVRFLTSMVKRSRGDINCIRIYCSYLLETVINHTNFEIDTFLSGITDIFLINVSDTQPMLLKDESINRTLSVLHSLVVLANTKKSLILKIVKFILKLHHKKSLDKMIIKKVLNIITIKVDNKPIEVYLNRNILSILHFWIHENYNLSDLPLEFFDIRNETELLNKHMKWLISADILWRQGGNVNDSAILKQTTANLKLTESKIIEICFCNIMVLCLPYIVTEKYNLRYVNSEGESNFKKSMINANRMYQLTRQILDSEKWSNLFVENVGEVLLLSAMHLSDSTEAMEQFQVVVPKPVETYLYPKIIFLSILDYFGELTDGNIMHYLCENQPIAIFTILFKLWENVLNENVLELKVLAIYAFKTFVECVPLVPPSDAFVCNYICNNFGFAIKKSKDNKEIKMLTQGLRSILDKFLCRNVGVIRTALSQLLSILNIKKEEGFEEESTVLLNYLVIDMKDYLKEEEDVVDFIMSMSSQSFVQNIHCSSVVEFSERLKTYKMALNCPSYESLLSLKLFLKNNRKYGNVICKTLKEVRFSENCGESAIHEVIHKLNIILKTVKDNKTVIEACNCISEIGTYDLKTLITVPPADTKKIVAAQPRSTVALATISSLYHVLFDEDPVVTNKITKTLNRLLKFKEAAELIDSCDFENILKPFMLEQETEYAKFKIDEVKFDLHINSTFMIPDDNENHKQWLVKHAAAILEILASESNYFNSLHEICLLKPTVCERILPALVGLLIYYSSEKNVLVISEQINKFFKFIWKMSFRDKIEYRVTNNNNSRNNAFDQNHKLMIKYMLEVVNYVRLQRNHYKSRIQGSNRYNYLTLDYDKVAWAATVADQNLSAIYYGELWAVAMNDGVPPSSPEATTSLYGGKNLQRILRKCFVSIAEMDAIDGCGTAHLTIEDEKRKHLINTGQYLDALLMHDIALSCSRADLEMQNGVVRSLHKSGMHHLALQYIKSLPENEQLNDVKYECLSSLGDWSEFVDTRDLEDKYTELNFDTQYLLKAFRYACLKDCLNIQTKPEFQNKLVQPLNRAKIAVSKLCQELNMENCQSVYKVLSKIHLFTDIEDYFAVRCDKLPLYELLDKWRVENLPAFQDFKHLEDLISQRNIILEHSAKSYADSLNDVISLQLNYAELSLKNQRIQMSQRLLAAVKKLQNSDQVTVLESQIYWAKGQRDIALSLLRNKVSDPANNGSNAKQTAMSLRLYGLWMAESKSDNARDIIKKYLTKGLEVLTRDDDRTRQKVYFDIAKFADAEYKQVVTYMNSSLFESKLKCYESIKETASTLRLTQESLLTKDERRALISNEKFKQLELTDIESTRTEKQTFLKLAMRYYLLSLKGNEDNNLSVFRVISLWLDNPEIEMDVDSDSFEDMLHAIPSRKFIAVLPQLAPRLTNDNNAFANNLKKIIKRCALEHPYHTLPILFSLKNSDKDKYILNASQAKTQKLPRSTVQEPRVITSESLVKEVANESAVHAVIVKQMEQLCDATISLANYKPKVKEQVQKIPAAETIHKLRHLDSIPIPTATVPIQSDCDYSNLCSLVSFDNYFELVAGINCPKKINCTNSNGTKNILLIKGEDDLRQDAVIQQVFNIVNTLLEKNAITNKNKLLIRTYKVVPMSRQSGVIEWCVGTMTIGAYLVGSASNPGAHARFRPKDISCTIAREILGRCHQERKSNKDKLKALLSIFKQLKPVFHYFFTEHYLDPVTWYERRLAYTKSVATSSMVGYILGLGDRHVQNILIDKNTAEVIHIDFGIAFDQGKALPTPETIPFRLTQDIISGFGCSGVEGIFRKCCEKTMQLLRDNQETLLTILEVLLCDPLYSWRVSSAQTAAQPNANITLCASGSNSGLAERALLAVNSKLSGTEGGMAGGVAVPGQVARLIHTATDPQNLCRLFPGWQPYL